MKRLVETIFVASLVLLPPAWWFKDAIGDVDVAPELRAAPLQAAVSEPPFDVNQGGVRYRVEPQYRYRLSGLVVSRRRHDGDSMLHGYWNDHLNVADVCVVWGDNATGLDFDAFEFRNGQFTCFVRTRDAAQWARFRMDQLSNNHLITENDYVRDRIEDLEIGDQIRIEGYLASYANDAGFRRGTSTVRTDTGNGACETIYVEDVSVIRTMTSVWRWLFDGAWLGLLVSGFGWVFGVGRGLF